MKALRIIFKTHCGDIKDIIKLGLIKKYSKSLIIICEKGINNLMYKDIFFFGKDELISKVNSK